MKYKLTDKTIQYKGKALYQIEAVKDFGNVRVGDLGGWIEYKDNLSQEGNCWVDDNAKVYNIAYIGGNAKVYDKAEVYGSARVYDNAEVYGHAKVYEDAEVWGNTEVYGKAEVCGYAHIGGNARISADSIFSYGLFIGGRDANGITEITDKTGNNYWKHQYVLGEYKIEPLNNDKAKLLEKAEKLIKKAEELKEEANKL